MKYVNDIDPDSLEWKLEQLKKISKNDPQLEDALRWVDSQAHQKGMTSYQVVELILQNKFVNESAKKWLKDRRSDHL